MADLEGVIVDSRERGSDEEYAIRGERNINPGQPVDTQQRRFGKRRGTNDSNNLKNGASDTGDPAGGPKEEPVVEDGRPGDGQSSISEEIRSRFYEDYHRVAEVYDREFNKRHDEDLDTALIFAGLFSAVTSAFIIEIYPDLQLDPNAETAALLRVLLYKIDNTTFGNDAPTVPVWSGPLSTVIQVQTILYAALAASLFSALLAMLGKQWLNRYASTDMRGTIIERSRNRQRKLNGIVDWYFEHVMEAPPQMLQIALLLLGCAMSTYLLDGNKTIPFVVLAFTSLGVLLYFFIVAAGTISDTCPYQTPGSRILRSAPLAVTSAFGRAIGSSKTARVIRGREWPHEPRWSRGNVVAFFNKVTHRLPGALITDAFRLGREMVWLLVTFARRVYAWLFGSPSTPTHGPDHRATLLELQCISWVLRTSLDKPNHLSALEYLAIIAELADFDPTLVADCFDILAGCVNIINHTVTIARGSDRLATASATCLLHTASHLSAVDPGSSVLGDVRQLYNNIFPPQTDFDDVPFHSTLDAIRGILNPGWRRGQ